MEAIRKILFENLTEIWQCADNCLVVYRKDRPPVRVTVAGRLRGPTEYVAEYEELISIRVDGMRKEIWARADYPRTAGPTTACCVTEALRLLNEEAARPCISKRRLFPFWR